MILKSAQGWWSKNKSATLGILLILIICFFYHSRVFASPFVDEQDNFILGKFILEGQKLYSDLFSHHQPLAYIISAVLQFLNQPENIYSLIKTHHEFAILWSFIWGVILILRFKTKVIAPLLIYELSKFYLLGELFLSESLAVYPILYLTLFLLEFRDEYKSLEYLLIGFLIALTGLLLAPVWPFLAGYLVFLVWIKKPNKKQFMNLLIATVVPLIIVLPFIDIYYYFHNTVYINFKYYIPQSAEEKMPLSIIKSLISPFTGLVTNLEFRSSGSILRITFIFFVIGMIHLIKTKKLRLLLAVVTLLTLANLRYYTPGLEYKAGFHLLIWYALFIFISFYIAAGLVKIIGLKAKNILGVGMVSSVILSAFISRDLFIIRDLEQDYKSNYSAVQLFGDAIKTMRSENDTLFVVPDEWLLYFQGEVENNNRMVNFYGWMSLVWELNDPVIEKFKTAPPEFFFCDCPEEMVSAYSPDYHQMLRNGAKTPLWVLNKKFAGLNEDQKTKLRNLSFQLE